MRIILLASLSFLLGALLSLLCERAYAQQCQQWTCTQIQNVRNCTCVYYGPVEDRLPWGVVLDQWSPYRNPAITPYYVPYLNPWR